MLEVISKSKINKLPIDKNEFTRQLENSKEGYRLELKRKRQQKKRAKLRDQKGTDIIKAEINKRKIESRKKLRDQKRSEIIKAEMRKQKMNYINKLKEEKGPEVGKDKLNRQKIKSRNKL